MSQQGMTQALAELKSERERSKTWVADASATAGNGIIAACKQERARIASVGRKGPMSPNRRIFLNVVATYGRSVFALFCGLFSSRWASPFSSTATSSSALRRSPMTACVSIPTTTMLTIWFCIFETR